MDLELAENNSSSSFNVFENPEAAMESGSATNLQVLDGNDIEAPEEDVFEDQAANGELREAIKALIRKADDLYWDLAAAIAKVANEKLYKKWGYSSFESYVNEECKIDKRKGQYLVQIHNYFTSALKTILVNHQETYDAYLDTVKRVGWVKARILAKEQVINETNADSLLEKIETATVRDLETICQVARQEMSDEDREKHVDENLEKKVRLTFQLSLAEHERVNKAVDHAQNLGHSHMTRNSALYMIASDYLDTNIAATGGQTDLPSLFARLEELHDVKLVVWNKAGTKIVYGDHNLAAISSSIEEGQETMSLD